MQHRGHVQGPPDGERRLPRELRHPPDSTVTFSSGGDAGGTTTGCTTTQDTSACTSTSTCKIANGGFTTNVSVNIKFASDGSSASGTVLSKTTKDADGSVLTDCTYDLTYTRQ